MTPDLRARAAGLATSGWVDVASAVRPRSFGVMAYLLLASEFVVPSYSMVQVTLRCWRPFRVRWMVVSEGAERFDLVDLKVSRRSQFTSGKAVSLRPPAGGTSWKWSPVAPDRIRWPLDVWGGDDVSVTALLADGHADGASFEVLLLGETAQGAGVARPGCDAQERAQ